MKASATASFRLYELDCGPALRFRSALHRNRSLLLVVLLSLVARGLRFERFDRADLLALLILLCLGLSLINVSLSLKNQSLARTEAVYSTFVLVFIINRGVRTVGNGFSTSEAVALLWSLAFALLAAYCLHRVISLNFSDLAGDQNVTRIFEPDSKHEHMLQADRTKVAIWGGGALCGSGAALASVPEGRGSDFFWLLTGILTLWWLCKGAALVIWMLSRPSTLYPFQLAARHSKARTNHTYMWFLATRSKAIRSAIFFALAGLCLGAAAVYEFLNPPPFVERLRASEAAVIITTTIPAILAWYCYRKSIATLMRGIQWRKEVEAVSCAGAFTLYLRSFEDDQFEFDSAGDWGRLLYLPDLLFFRGMNARSKGLEELITGTLWPYGPVLSVALPGEAFRDSALELLIRAGLSSHFNDARLGKWVLMDGSAALRAASLRLAVESETWQEEVLRLAEKAKSIVMVMAHTPGLKWEFQTMAARPALRNKLVLLVPPEDPAGVFSRWSRAFDPQHELSAMLSHEAIARTLVLKFTEENEGMVMLTADERSAAAYRLALEISQTGLGTEDLSIVNR